MNAFKNLGTINGKSILKLSSPQAKTAQQKELIEGEKISKNYHPLKVIGKGAYGVVFTARDQVGDLVAIKKVRENPMYKNREVEIMEMIKNLPNVVTIKNHYRTSLKNQNDIFQHIVMDYMPNNLHDFVFAYRKQKKYPPMLYVKLFSYQMFQGLDFLHKYKIVHRDIKPQNLLINEETGDLKICDFGSAKRLVSDEKNVSYIQSRYYRAPELIYDCQYYTTAIDIWSAGCVIAEMLLAGQPIFMSDSSTGQLFEIAKILGNPTEKELMTFKHNVIIRMPDVENPIGLKKVLPENTPKEALDLLNKIFTYCPSKRPTARDCMESEFFDEIFDDEERLNNGRKLPQLKKNA
ncbi:CMGC family protein kinase [Tritrichomonas foetus]|uniref:non-specific serine/threonine protein kinase n=1 Tax=Tritrichomonas foetus TaxID=1144522 RepID=A0A1J4J1X4_9EUKA|nr:CMGC family protein kinase [Tritrichomonas foetus]|eukprot:OHS92761.1 CMGC family protein kinase [Tritrichomonas foetus]